LRAGPHFLDWANQPIPYKIYSSLEPIPLQGDFPPSIVSALDAIEVSGQEITGEHVPDLSTIARVCFFSNGITKRWRISSGEVFALRAAAWID